LENKSLIKNDLNLNKILNIIGHQQIYHFFGEIKGESRNFSTQSVECPPALAHSETRWFPSGDSPTAGDAFSVIWIGQENTNFFKWESSSMMKIKIVNPNNALNHESRE